MGEVMPGKRIRKGERHEHPCPHCGSETVIRFGRLKNGLQRYQCQDCRKTYTPDSRSKEIRQARKQQILQAYRKIGSIRRTARLFGVTRNTLSGWLRNEDIERA